MIGFCIALIITAMFFIGMGLGGLGCLGLIKFYYYCKRKYNNE